MGYGVKAGLLLSLRVPYDVKDQRIDYRTLDGEPFAPPYGDIHHRTERLDGFGDGELGVSARSGPRLPRRRGNHRFRSDAPRKIRSISAAAD